MLLHEVLAHLHAAIAVNTLHDVHTLGSIVLLTSVDVVNGYAYHLVVLNRLNTRPEVVVGIVEVGTAAYYLDAELVDHRVDFHFERIGEEDAGLYLASSAAGGA